VTFKPSRSKVLGDHDALLRAGGAVMSPGGAGFNPPASGSPITYLLRVEFSTDDAAPLTNPYVGEVGSVVPVEVDGTLAASGGVLTNTAQATPAEGDLGFYRSSGFARVAGRVLLVQFTPSTLNIYPIINWNTSASASSVPTEMNVRVENPLGINDTGYISLAYALANATAYQFALVLRGTGAFLFVKGGVFTAWTLAWVRTTGSTATLFPSVGYYNGVGTSDFVRVYDLPSPFNSDYGIATFTDTTLTSGDTFTGTADAIVDFEFTLPGAPSAGDEIVVRFRRTDDNNCWKTYVKRNVGNTAWDVFVDSVSAGVPTTRITATGVGTPDAMRIISEGSKHDLFTRESGAWTKRGVQANTSHLNTNTDMSITVAAGTTLTRLTSYPRTTFSYSLLDQT
jgi:hypothetical protein